VFCTAMVPRSTESEDKMRAYRQEFHRRSNRLGVTYHPIDDYFPRTRPHMWSRDGIHLSDQDGMPLLAELMWIAAYQFLETPEPKPLVQSQVSRPYKPRFVPRVVVKGVERAPPPPPSEWTLVKSGRKRNHSGESESTSDSPKKRVVHRERDGTPVALKECYIPLNPVRFSPVMLAAMEKVSPSALGDVHTGDE
ncbi:hypothetical protein ATANTOWER_031503, partial [Ataeniobius toweri]|nr:hypothetical protein [Ataeniobius toweri]